MEHFCSEENIQVWIRVREDKLHKVRPPERERLRRREI